MLSLIGSIPSTRLSAGVLVVDVFRLNQNLNEDFCRKDLNCQELWQKPELFCVFLIVITDSVG